MFHGNIYVHRMLGIGRRGDPYTFFVIQTIKVVDVQKIVIRIALSKMITCDLFHFFLVFRSSLLTKCPISVKHTSKIQYLHQMVEKQQFHVILLKNSGCRRSRVNEEPHPAPPPHSSAASMFNVRMISI